MKIIDQTASEKTTETSEKKNKLSTCTAKIIKLNNSISRFRHTSKSAHQKPKLILKFGFWRRRKTGRYQTNPGSRKENQKQLHFYEITLH
jgi:hypothetical protein